MQLLCYPVHSRYNEVQLGTTLYACWYLAALHVWINALSVDFIRTPLFIFHSGVFLCRIHSKPLSLFHAILRVYTCRSFSLLIWYTPMMGSIISMMYCAKVSYVSCQHIDMMVSFLLPILFDRLPRGVFFFSQRAVSGVILFSLFLYLRLLLQFLLSFSHFVCISWWYFMWLWILLWCQITTAVRMRVMNMASTARDSMPTVVHQGWMGRHLTRAVPVTGERFGRVKNASELWNLGPPPPPPPPPFHF